MQGRVILVVEDDPMLQLSMKAVLKRMGHEVHVVGSGEAAIEWDENELALVFMDLGLPGIQGDDAARLIREKEERENRKRVPIIALTGHARKGDCLASGMDDYLQKPALMKDLELIINKWAPELSRK
jgi:CheY-like chemotaxis protein